MKKQWKGVRWRLVHTPAHGRGPGRTHLQYWHRTHKEWEMDCTSRRYRADEQGTPALKSECCTRCIDMIERVFGVTDDSCPECHNKFDGRMPGWVYGSNWDWVDCQVCHGTGKDPALLDYEGATR